MHGGSAQGGDAAAAGRAGHRIGAGRPRTSTGSPWSPARPVSTTTWSAVAGAERSLSSVRLLTSGTAPLEPDDFAQVRHPDGPTGLGGLRAVGVRLGRDQFAAHREPHHGSVGRPLPGIELRVLGPDGARRGPGRRPGRPPSDAEPIRARPLDFVADAPDAGEVGRIAIRGATLFSGYWPDGGGGPGADGWFVTGDIGYLDDAGELHLVDRAAEVIKVAGFTVYPREVEEVLANHPYVAEVAVIGMPGPTATSRWSRCSPRRRRAGAHPRRLE